MAKKHRSPGAVTPQPPAKPHKSAPTVRPPEPRAAEPPAAGAETSHKHPWWHELAVGVLLALVIFAVYYSCKDTTSLADPVWTLDTSLSILKTGQPYLDQYPYINVAVMKVGAHSLYSYPLLTPYLVTPAVAAVDWWFRHFRSLDMYQLLQQAPHVEIIREVHLLLASLITALSALVIYATGRQFLGRWRSVFLALLFAFTTSAWSTASRDLWQHTTSVLFLALALYLLLLARKRPSLVQLAGFFLALAYVARPTNSIPVLLLTVYVALEYRKYLPGYLAAALIVAVPFFAFNHAIYGQWMPPYFNPGKLSHGGLDLSAFAGTLVSPARGLLIFSPIFLFVAYGIYRKVRCHDLSRLDLFLIAILVLHWVLISYWGTWWAGDSYGPRFFTDMLPFLMYFLIPVIAALRRPATAVDWALGVAFGAVVVVSFGMNYVGGARGESWRWNVNPSVPMPTGNTAERMWDWSDPQFLRGIRPGELAAAPGRLCFVASAGEPSAQAQLAVGNRGYSALDWQMTLPERVSGDPPCNPVYPFTYCVINLAADTSGYAVGTHGLGTLHLSARRAGLWGGARNTPQDIPASLQVLPAGASKEGVTDCYAPPGQ